MLRRSSAKHYLESLVGRKVKVKTVGYKYTKYVTGIALMSLLIALNILSFFKPISSSCSHSKISENVPRVYKNPGIKLTWANVCFHKF